MICVVLRAFVFLFLFKIDILLVENSLEHIKHVKHVKKVKSKSRKCEKLSFKTRAERLEEDILYYSH